MGEGISIDRCVGADRAAAYEAWADPTRIAGWWADESSGRMEPGATVTLGFRGFGAWPHTVDEALPGERLVLGNPAGGRQVITFSDEQGGGTRIRVVHEGCPDHAEARMVIESGWRLALASLAFYLDEPDRGAAQHRNVIVPARFEWDQVRELYSTEQGLASWLPGAPTLSADPLVEGSRATLPLADDRLLEGVVYCTNGHEVMFAWPEVDGVMTFKSFTMGPDSYSVALDLRAFGIDEAEADRLESVMATTLEPLVALLS